MKMRKLHVYSHMTDREPDDCPILPLHGVLMKINVGTRNESEIVIEPAMSFTSAVSRS